MEKCGGPDGGRLRRVRRQDGKNTLENRWMKKMSDAVVENRAPVEAAVRTALKKMKNEKANGPDDI